MSRADFLLYRRMRGVFWGLLVIGVVVAPILMVTGFGIATGTDGVSEGLRDDVGRPEDLMALGIGMAGFIALIAAVILGATAGSVDHQRGVLRDLVLAGRARWRIVVGRLLAAAGWLVLALAVSFAACIALGSLLAPIDASVDWETVFRNSASFAFNLAYTMPFAAGVALLVGSRGPAIAVYFAVAFVVDGVLSSIPKVRDWWEHVSLGNASMEVDGVITGRTEGFDGDAWQALAVIAGWALIPFVLGLVRLTRRDL